MAPRRFRTRKGTSYGVVMRGLAGWPLTRSLVVIYSDDMA
jgi:hypothetical protein